MTPAEREHKNATARRRRKLKAYGRYESPLVPADATRAHIEHLRSYGLSKDAIARLAGWSCSGMVEQITCPAHNAYRAYVSRETQARVLALDFDLDVLLPTEQVDVTGTQRRIRALSAIGWSRDELARRLGFTSTYGVSSWLHYSRRYITAANARAVRDLYNTLGMTPGPSSRAIGRAQRSGWPPPLAWDDETIDDPAAQPLDIARPARRSQADAIAELDDLLDIDPDILAEHAARRLGYAEASNLYTTIDRAGRPDLRARLDRNAPPPPVITAADLFPSARRNRKENAA